MDYTYCYILVMPNRIPVDTETAEILRTMLKLDAFYPRLSVEKVAELFPKSGLYQFARGEPVIKQGAESKHVYILGHGRVQVTQRTGTEVRDLAVLEAPNMFGEIALIHPYGKRTADVTAVVPSSIFYLIVEDVQRIMQATSELGEHLMRLAAERLGRQGPLPGRTAGD